MTVDQMRKLIGGILLVSLLLLGFSKPFHQYMQLPSAITVFEGQELSFGKAQAVTVAAGTGSGNLAVTEEKDAVTVAGKNMGDDKVVLELAGFPIKKVDVNVLKDFKVYPGGQSIGVKLNTLGVLVVGHHLVEGADEDKTSPGETAGIKVGDIIAKIDGNHVKNMMDVGPYVDEAGKSGKPLKLTIHRGKEVFDADLVPKLDKQEEKFKMGLYIRDSAAGIGTMTFFDGQSKKYGALGHVISDMDTKKPIVVDNGQIVKSTVTSIEKGKNGAPGEKLARFSTNREVIGNITRNSPFGIFGKLHGPIENGVLDKPMPIGLANEVKEGPAKILTVVAGNKVEEYDIEVVSTVPQKFPATKGMVIKVTDPGLLSKTGGIVQGMSGSPIIQGGKIIGAVTHVFVNDPTSGYGVHIEWMLHEAGIDIYAKSSNAS